MTLPFFFNKTGVNYNKKKKPTSSATDSETTTKAAKETLYPTLSSLIQRTRNIPLHETISIPDDRATTPISAATCAAVTLAAAATTSTEQEQFKTLPAIPVAVNNEETVEEEDIDENFFYKHLITHFHPLFVESSMICIPHTKSIQGLVLTKDIIESHCFLPSPYFCGQYMATKLRKKNIAFDYPLITTLEGYQKERIVHVMAEETVSYRNRKIRLLLIDQLLEGETPKHYCLQQHKPTITIPPVRNSKNDLEFLNMFPENFEAIYELQLAVQEFTDSYVYVKGYNKSTVERIQHMYMKAYKTILKRNSLLEESCRIPSEHDRFLELVENVVMSLLYKKIWKQSLQSLLASQDKQVQHLCQIYSTVTLSQLALRYPISEMDQSCFEKAIDSLRRLDAQQYTSVLDPHTAPSSTLNEAAFTPLEKFAALKEALELISDAVSLFVKEVNSSSVTARKLDASLTSDEMIPLLAYIMIQCRMSRIASMIYYMQHYRLARMAEGSVYNFVLTTLKSACEFLKHDPLSLQQKYQQEQAEFNTLCESASLLLPSDRRGKRPSSIYSIRSVRSYNPTPNHPSNSDLSASSSARLLQHRKSQSADLSSTMSSTLNSNITKKPSSSPAATSTPISSHNAALRPHYFVLPQSQSVSQHRKSVDWALPSTTTAFHDSSVNTYNSDHHIPSSPTSPSSTVSSLSTTTSPLSPTTQPLLPYIGMQKKPFYNHLNSSKPIISTTFPSLSNSMPLFNSDDNKDNDRNDEANQPCNPLYLDIPKLCRSHSASTNNNTSDLPSQPRHQHRKAPAVININMNRRSFIADLHSRPRQYLNNRPASICLDTRSFQHLASSSSATNTYHRNHRPSSKSTSDSCNSSVYSADHVEEYNDAMSIRTTASSSSSSSTSSITSSSAAAPISQEELMGDFLLGLSQLDGNVIGGRSGTLKTTTTITTKSFKKR